MVIYQKGGRIQKMILNYFVDYPYFKSLGNYLTANKFKSAEAHQLRLAFEDVTGKDLNWYWNQWYFGSGHPVVKINYNYDDAAGKALVIVEQTQTGNKLFKLPLAIDVYNGTVKKRYTVWAENKVDTFSFEYTQKPDLINVDADKVMLWQKTDNKTAENYLHQLKNAPLFLDRREALDYFAKKGMKELTEGLQDKFAPLREFTLVRLAGGKMAKDATVLKAVETLVAKEKNKKAKAAAINLLAKTEDAKYLPLFKANVTDSSYSVSGAALSGLAALEPSNAYTLAKKYVADAKGDLGEVVDGIIMGNGAETDFDFITDRFNNAPLGQAKFEALDVFCNYLAKLKNMDNVKKGIDGVIKFRNAIPENFRSFTDPAIKDALSKVSKAKGVEIADYIKSFLN